MKKPPKFIVPAIAVIVIGFFAFAEYGFAHEAHNKPAANVAANSASPEAGTTDTKPGEQPQAGLTEFPTIHPMIVHFPIVLLIVAAFVQIASFFVFRRELGWMVVVFVLIGAIGAYLASYVYHPHTTGLTANAERLLLEHELYADYTVWLAIAGLIAKIVSQFALKRAWWSEAVVTLLLIGSAVAVALAGHHGAELVHKEGVGAKGAFLEMHDH